MKEEITQRIRNHVVNEFQEKWVSYLSYHDLHHTLNVSKFAVQLGEMEGCTPDELETLKVAALFHDVAYLTSYFDHEDRSKEIAKKYLQSIDYKDDKIEKVLQIIEATKASVEPKNVLEKVIKDADLYNLASTEYPRYAQKLKREWEHFLNNEDSESKWYKGNIQFLKSHEYYTKSAHELFSEQKQLNLDKLKEDRQKLKQRKDKIELKKNKSAQMMFKTALRNHIDLTHIADNKANIMLTINSILITITMPLIASNIKSNPDLLLPTIILLLTSVASIIFATLVTRPVRTVGHTLLDHIPTGKTNLFFFGNFYKMSIDQFKKGMNAVVADDNILDQSIMNDLYYLGKALGSKFQRLRYCYIIFMTGMVLTVLSFFITFFV